MTDHDHRWVLVVGGGAFPMLACKDCDVVRVLSESEVSE